MLPVSKMNMLKTRLAKFGDKAKEAFKDVQGENKQQIKWFDDEGLTRPIKTVRCFTGLSTVVPVKKDEQGNDIGFVKPGNNHHIAIYTDNEGKKQEHVCTFWHAVERKKYGIPVIINNTNEVWDKILLQAEGTYPESFLEKLPHANWTIELSMQQNEMFVLGMTKDDIESAILNNDYIHISDKLYLVWSLSEGDYWFKHHLETKGSDLKSATGAKDCKRYYRVQSGNALYNLQPYKLKIDCLGNIKKQ